MSCAELLPAVPVLMALRFPYPSPMPPVLPFRGARLLRVPAGHHLAARSASAPPIPCGYRMNAESIQAHPRRMVYGGYDLHQPGSAGQALFHSRRSPCRKPVHFKRQPGRATGLLPHHRQFTGNSIALSVRSRPKVNQS